MATFTLLIQHSPQQGQHSYSALQFAAAAIEKGHKVQQVFFYGDGVAHGNGMAVQLADETDIAALWSEFAASNAIELVICATVASRHGVSESNLAKGYSAGGLAEYIEAVANSDRLLQF